MKNSVLGCLVLLLSLLGFAPLAQAQVVFENLSFEEAQTKAQKEGKIIFVDVMRGGMGRLAANERVEKEIFTIDSVSAFFRDNCVSIRMDMSSEAGKAFAPNLNMLMYPAYVFYDANGAQLQFTNAHSVQNNPGLLMEKARQSAEVAEVKRSNSRHIEFARGEWKDLLAQAKASGKLIFLDAQTEWCRPCRMMERDVFNLDKVADFYNSNFINVSMDMEKGDGPVLGKRYEIRAYPTYLFIDGDGNVVHRDDGYKEADLFLGVGQAALAKIQSGVQFQDGDWNSVLAQAKKDNKLIFLDAYAVWCGPCKIMDRDVFPLAEVGQFFNGNFINVKRDMEKGEGIELSKRYGVKAYPTYLFINGDGEEVHRIVGGSSPSVFLERAKVALDPSKQRAAMDRRYQSGERTTEFITAYLDLLNVAYERDEAAKVASEYLESLPVEQLRSEAHWKLTAQYLNNPLSPVLSYYAQNRSWLGEIGVENPDRAIGDLYSKGIYALYSAKGSTGSQAANLKVVKKELQKAGLPEAEELVRLGQIQESIRMKNWKELASVLNAVSKKGQRVYGQAVPVTLGQYVPTLLKESAGKYSKQAHQWVDQLMPKMNNLLDQSKLWDLKATAYKQAGEESLAEEAAARSKALVAQWQEENKGSGMMMAVPMKLQ